MQPKLLGGRADVLRVKIRRLQQHILRGGVDLGIQATHHTGQRNAFLRICDQ